MKKTINILLIGLMVLVPLSQSKAQVSGNGNGNTGSLSITSGVTYTDAVRTRVTAISSTGSPTTNLTVVSTTGLSTGANCMCLLIQMIGGTIGTHQNVIVNTIGATVQVTAVNGNILSGFSTGASDRLQLIVIPQYTTVSISGGVITCNAWDGETGGVLCFVANSSMSVTGGLITASGKGYRSVDDGSAFASGGTGGSPNSTWVAGSILAPVDAYFDDNSGSGCTVVSIPSGKRGDNGGVQGSTPASPSTNSGSKTSYGGSTYYTLLRMGSPGYWKTASPAYGGGRGAYGGGYGGTGGSTACPNTGSSGTIGVIGGPGGDAGKGGNGGGAMVIKVASLNINTTPSGQIVFSCSGQNGQHGGNGHEGGSGGNGGQGGQGCIGECMDAGRGAHGDYGEGGVGGDAGDGGKPGTIWIACSGTFTTNASPSDDNFTVKGGKGGAGGSGGWGDYNLTVSPQDMINRCTSVPCYSSSGNGCDILCDADGAMCYLANNALSTDVSGSNTLFYDATGGSGGSGNIIGTYDPSINELEVTDGCNIWIANWRDVPIKDPDIMFPYFRTTGAYMGAIDYSIAPVKTGCAGGGGPIHIEFYNSASQLVLSYDHALPGNPKSQAYIEEAILLERCYVEDCSTNSGAGNQAADGRDGDDAADGVLNLGQLSSTDNVYVETNALWKKSPNGIDKPGSENPLQAKVYPNPASKEIWVEMDGLKNSYVMINIIDITGKLVMTQNEKLEDGKNKFHLVLKDLSTGLYLIELKTENATSTLNFKIK